MAKRPAPSRSPNATGIRIAIVTAEFNQDINDAMRESAHTTAKRLGATVTVDVRAPGVFDIPVLADAALKRDDVDALVALGAVITGETAHDEVVTYSAATALAELATFHGKPVGLGITGPRQSRLQAQARVPAAAWAVESVCKQFRTLRALRSPE